MASEDSFNKVKVFVEKTLYIGKEDPPITKSTSLYHDLGLYGDDVDQFFTYFLEEFDVDVSQYNFDIHFPPELGCLFGTLFTFLGFIPKTFPPLTIIDLANAVDSGKLINKRT